MITKKDRFIQKLRKLGMKYIKLSFLLNQLAESLSIKFKGNMNEKEFRKYVKEELNLDFDKIINQTEFFREFELEELKK